MSKKLHPTPTELMDMELVDEVRDTESGLMSSVFMDDDGACWAVLYIQDGNLNTLLNGYHQPCRCHPSYQPPKEFA